MRKVFVAVPPNYGLDDNGVRAYIHRIEETAHKAEKILDQYVEVENRDYSFLTVKDTNDKCVKDFIFNSLYTLCRSDLAVFAIDWEFSKECRLLRNIAIGFDIPILNIDTE